MAWPYDNTNQNQGFMDLLQPDYGIGNQSAFGNPASQNFVNQSLANTGGNIANAGGIGNLGGAGAAIGTGGGSAFGDFFKGMKTDYGIGGGDLFNAGLGLWQGFMAQDQMDQQEDVFEWQKDFTERQLALAQGKENRMLNNRRANRFVDPNMTVAERAALANDFDSTSDLDGGWTSEGGATSRPETEAGASDSKFADDKRVVDSGTTAKSDKEISDRIG